MAKAITVDRLGEEIAKILDEYATDITGNVEEATRRVTKMGVKTVKSESLRSFKDVNLDKGRYGTGWTSQIETGRFSAQGTIYNYKYPGLPHLLEYGHANRNGGRTPGHIHIAPVEEKINEDFERKIENEIKRLS